MTAGDLTVSKKRKRRERKPFSRDEKTILCCSLFGSMLFLFSNFQQQQTVLDVVLIIGITMSLLFIPLWVKCKIFV